MTRSLTTSVSTAIGQEVVEPFFAVDFDFASGPLYLWTGYGNLCIGGTGESCAGGKIYLGAGQLMNISTVEETTEIEAKGATITLSGIPSSFLSLALAEPYQGRECRIYFGMTDNPSDYMEIFTGELDQMNIAEDASTSAISVTAENVLIKLERPVVRRFTNQDQQSRYPGDLGLEFVASLQDKEIYWGRTAKQ